MGSLEALGFVPEANRFKSYPATVDRGSDVLIQFLLDFGTINLCDMVQ